MIEVMKRLRDAPTSSGRPKLRKVSSRAMQAMLCSGVLPKPMPGSSTIRSRAMPAVQAISSEREKNSVYVGDDVDGRIGGLAIVHDDDGRAVLGDDARHVGIALQAPDIVDDGGAGLERPGRDARL